MLFTVCSATRTLLRRTLPSVAGVAVTVIGMTSVMSGFLSPDHAHGGVSDMTFAKGTVVLGVMPQHVGMDLPLANPGDQVTHLFTVTDSGSMGMRYGITSRTTENVLAGMLVATVKVGVKDCSDAGFPASGTVIGKPGPVGSIVGLNLIGDPAQGQQAGDRALAAHQTEPVCINVSLPATTGNAAEGRSTSVVFTFDVEQTANN